MRPSISILSSDHSGNALGRAYVLAKLLQEEFDVHIVTFGEGGGIWAPIRNDASIEYRRFFYGSVPGFWLNAPRTVRQLISGDLILAVKPLHQSYGLGLYARRLLGRPLVLDIDDWEPGFLSDSLYWEFRLHLLQWVSSARSPLYTRFLDRFTGLADAITVSNSFLQQRYGGTWVPHARDERLFLDSAPATGDRKKVLFLGTARLNKGLDTLLSAWSQVPDPDARLRIIGTPLDSPLIRPLQSAADSRTAFEGPVPFEAMPAIIASAGAVVIPQQLMRGSVGQLPAKLMDAMAAGRPIISTAVGDIPKWLSDGAGVVVPPGDPRALGLAIRRVLADPEGADSIGRRAREQFLRYGSFASVRARLLPLVADLIAGRPLPPPQPAFSDEPEAESCEAAELQAATVG